MTCHLNYDAEFLQVLIISGLHSPLEFKFSLNKTNISR